MFEKLQESLATIGMDAQEKKAYTNSAKFGDADKNAAPTGIDLTGAEIYTGYKEILKALNIEIKDFLPGYDLRVYVVRNNISADMDTVKKSAKTMVSILTPKIGDTVIRVVTDSKFLKLAKKYQATLLAYNLLKKFGKQVVDSSGGPRIIKTDNGEYGVYDIGSLAYIMTAALFGTWTTRKAISLEMQMMYKTSKDSIKHAKEEMESDFDESIEPDEQESSSQSQSEPQPEPQGQPA